MGNDQVFRSEDTSHAQLSAYTPKQGSKFSMLLDNVVNIFHLFWIKTTNQTHTKWEGLVWHMSLQHTCSIYPVEYWPNKGLDLRRSFGFPNGFSKDIFLGFENGVILVEGSRSKLKKDSNSKTSCCILDKCTSKKWRPDYSELLW